MSDIKLLAYNAKTKEKGREVQNPVVNKIVSGKRTTYIVRGKDTDGTTLSVITNRFIAEQAIDSGVATKGEGWD